MFPGSSLHEELALLVDAGLTPMEALQAATRNAAVFMGKLDTLGTLEKGKSADMVLLDRNPLDDIRNTRTINAVVVRGKVLSKGDLEKQLINVEANVSNR
jgi:imidazolonepropionase-like amidohydrolase